MDNVALGARNFAVPSTAEHPTDPSLHAALARALPDLAELPKRLLHAGDEAVYALGEAYIVRASRTVEATRSLAKQATLLRKLQSQLAPLAVPEVACFVALSPSCAGLASPRLPGRTPAEVGLHQLGASFPAHLAGTLRALHALEPRELASPELPLTPAQEWLETLDALGAQALALVSPHLPPRTLGPLRHRLEELSQACRRDLPSPRLLHGDFDRHNLLLDPSGERVVAVLDWSEARFGDPAYDLRLWAAELPSEQAAAFVTAYAQSDAALAARVELYRRLVWVERFADAVADGDPTTAARALDAVRSSG